MFPVVTCPEINGTDHGSMTCSHVNGNFTYLSNCHFNCSDGYVLVGSENLSCTKDGDWGAHIPHCKGMYIIYGIIESLKTAKI